METCCSRGKGRRGDVGEVHLEDDDEDDGDEEEEGLRKIKNSSSREDIIGKANLVKNELTKNAATSTDTMQESL